MFGKRKQSQAAAAEQVRLNEEWERLHSIDGMTRKERRLERMKEWTPEKMEAVGMIRREATERANVMLGVGEAPPPPKPTRSGGNGQTYNRRFVNVPEAISKHAHVDLTIWRNGPATLCMASVDGLVSISTAICHPKDVFVEELGENIAVGRALRFLGQKILDTADGNFCQNVVQSGS